MVEAELVLCSAISAGTIVFVVMANIQSLKSTLGFLFFEFFSTCLLRLFFSQKFAYLRKRVESDRIIAKLKIKNVPN